MFEVPFVLDAKNIYNKHSNYFEMWNETGSLKSHSVLHTLLDFKFDRCVAPNVCPLRAPNSPLPPGKGAGFNVSYAHVNMLFLLHFGCKRCQIRRRKIANFILNASYLSLNPFLILPL